MEFDIEWNEEHEVATITHHQLVLDCRDTITRWKAELFAKLDVLLLARQRKFPIVVCLDNFMIRPRVADNYGRVVREMIDRYATSVVRYGEPSTVKQIIAVEAMKEGFRANLFESFEQAVRYLKQEIAMPMPPRSVRGSIGLNGLREVSSARSALNGLREVSPSRSALPRPAQTLKAPDAPKPKEQSAGEEPRASGGGQPQRRVSARTRDL